MNARYLKRISDILSDARPRLAKTHELEFKNCFGAVAGYVNGKIFISCGKFGVALKLPPKTISNLLEEKGVRHLKYFPNGHIKKDYVVLPRRITEDRNRSKKLVSRSITFVLDEK